MFFGEQPDPARVEAWNRTYRDHARNPTDPTRCAIPDCLGRFPCAFRLEAAELLIVAGIGLPDVPPPEDDGLPIPHPRRPRFGLFVDPEQADVVRGEVAARP